MAITTAPFFDPNLAMIQRQLAFSTQTGTADLRLRGQRIQEDANLFRPFLERRFANQMDQTAGNVAQRGFHGSRSGIMKQQLGSLAEDQVYTQGEFERGSARGLEDVERAIANLTQQNIISGAEATRQGAGRAAERNYPRYPSF